MNEEVKCCAFSFSPYPPPTMFPLLSTTKMMRGDDWVLLEVYYLYLQKTVEKSSTYPPFIYKLCFLEYQKVDERKFFIVEFQLLI